MLAARGRRRILLRRVTESEACIIDTNRSNQRRTVQLITPAHSFIFVSLTLTIKTTITALPPSRPNVLSKTHLKHPVLTRQPCAPLRQRSIRPAAAAAIGNITTPPHTDAHGPQQVERPRRRQKAIQVRAAGENWQRIVGRRSAGQRSRACAAVEAPQNTLHRTLRRVTRIHATREKRRGAGGGGAGT
jgi:hypothetical protein